MQRRFDAIMEEILRVTGNDCPRKDGTAIRMLLAVSGGIDSMCMADLALHSASGLRFAVAHCNFHLRGTESDSDTALVRDWCGRNGIGIYVADFDTSRYASENGLSIEMAARELRYRWFGSLCREHGFAGVLVAHNANDNAETLVLNLLRGTGLRGLAGMGTVSPLPFCPEETGCIRTPFVGRPLLDFTRKQIEGHVRSEGILYHEDSTNADTAYRRNRIRNEVFPLFEKINPSFVRTLNREMKYLASAEGLLEELVGTSFPDRSRKTSRQQEGETRITIRELLACRHWQYLLYMDLEPFGFNSAAIASVGRLVSEAEAGRTTLAGKTFRSETHLLVTSATELIIRPLPDVKAEGDVLDGTGILTVAGPGTYSFGRSVFTVESKRRADLDSLKCPEGTLIFDSSRMQFPFVCRRWRRGDWLRPLGMRGRKKVSDLFTDLKFDAFKKAETIVCVPGDGTDSHIRAVLGIRIDDSVKVSSATSEVTVVTLRNPI